MNPRIAFQTPYSYWLVGAFVLYMFLTLFLSNFYVSVQYIPYYLGQIEWFELGLSALLSLSIGFFVALNSVLLYVRFKNHQKSTAQTTLSCVAGIGGLTTGICPVCVAGFFPLLLELIGVTFSWGLLPFNGIEAQVFLVIMLGGSLYWMVKS